MTVNKAMVFSGVCTLLQALGQMVFASLGLAQHFCFIDFLQELPLLIYIKILYFHNPNTCGPRISIGQAIEGAAAQAFVLLQDEPFTAFRTFIINCVSLGLAVFWAITSVIILLGGARNKKSKSVRWPWIVVTVCMCVVDIVATVIYANDSFHTRTLSDILDFIGGTVSGIGNMELSTSWASWIMVILYSRAGILFVLNVFLVIGMVVECNMKKDTEENVTQVEAPVEAPPVQVPVQRSHEVATETSDLDDADVDLELADTPSVERIPRPGLSQSFRRMKSILFKRSPSPERLTRSSPDSLETSEGARRAGEQPSRIPRPGLTNSFRRMKTLLFRKSPIHERSRFYTDSLEASPERSPQHHRMMDKNEKRTVNFPSTLSHPHRLENLIAEQQRRLDRAGVDTSGRRSPPGPPRASQSLPHLDSAPSEGRRGTTAGLPGQMPWAYIPAPASRMHDQLPPGEDRPPVPLPDYTAIPSFRKASVHRAASSLSTLTQKRDYAWQSTRPTLTHSDVLY